jgi:RNA polymerase sigma factor for flagellar operon FliA
MDCSRCPDIDMTARQDPQQVEALIEAYAPQVKYLAHRLVCRLPASIDVDDLISAGVLGLLDAIKKYDPTHATSLKTYAEYRIQGAMLDYVRAWDWVPRSVREKEHALTEAYAAIARQQGRPATDEEVAAWLELDLDTFDHWLTEVRGVAVVSLEQPLAQDAEGHAVTLLAQLAEETPGPCERAETAELKQHLAEAIDALPQQEKVVLSLYYFEELTMREIGQVLAVTESRISQIHTTAMLHLRATLQNLTHDTDATAASPRGGPLSRRRLATAVCRPPCVL